MADEYSRAQQCHEKYPALYGHVMMLNGKVHCLDVDAAGNVFNDGKPCTADCEPTKAAGSCQTTCTYYPITKQNICNTVCF
jgi:hypothetical protein